METQVTQSQIADLYKTILQQEDAHTTMFITVLLGIAALLLGVTWWWNKAGANRYIKENVKKEVAKELEIITKEIQTTIESKIKTELQAFEKHINGKLQNIELMATSVRTNTSDLNETKTLLAELKSHLNEEFYFIRLRARLHGDLEWNYQSEMNNMNFKNIYVSEKEKLLLKSHTKWFFGNTAPAIKD
jgi:hypothetical protein